MPEKAIVTRYHESYDPEIIKLCAAFSRDSLAEYGLSVSEDRLNEMREVCRDSAFFLVVEGKPVGLIAGMWVNNLTNGKLALQEVIWYVYKEYRGQSKILLTMFEGMAKAMGASHVIVGLLANSFADKVGRLYERMGYEKFEVQYMKSL